MKVLFLSRKTLFSVYGGDTVQVFKTAEALRRKGVEVDISTDLTPPLQGYDLVHVFNLTRPQETYTQVLYAKQQGYPVALSTIYLNNEEYEHKMRHGILGRLMRSLNGSQIEYLKVLGRAVKNREFHKGTISLLLRGYKQSLSRVCSMVDVFLPNSCSEMNRLQSDLRLQVSQPVCVVPYAVDTECFRSDQVVIPSDLKRYLGCVLCVARIESRKNQLNLVRAMKETPYHLVLIGATAPNHKDYYARIKKEAGDRVTILGSMTQEELRVYYKLCRVHVLASWMETCGLASLEAAAMGANIVITNRGDTKEYFQEDAFYCEPDDVRSIRDVILKAYQAPPPFSLQERVRRCYVWDLVAKETLKGYGLALKRKRPQ